jgi:hypothetical protein
MKCGEASGPRGYGDVDGPRIAEAAVIGLNMVRGEAVTKVWSRSLVPWDRRWGDCGNFSSISSLAPKIAIYLR